MDNLHRELAPISAAAWADLEDEARRTFRRHIGGRRVVDVVGPGGTGTSAVGLGHLRDIESHAEGVRARLRTAQPIVELRVPFTVERQQVDDVERGAKDADWQPVKDAARVLAFAEDRAVFDGYPAAGIAGLRASASNRPIPLPEQVRNYPDAVSQALTTLRLAGVNGPYTLALGAEAYTAVNETADHGYPVRDHLTALLDGEPVWTPGIDGAFLLSTRGGDFELHLGQDVSIGYSAHDATNVQLYFQETMTFLVYTTEAAVALPAPAAG
ncbi:MAG TPA: family 1 encapsulin nanocompartment shell protein [Dactylosporangium sp.]|nr:family 1 encapsulin nanocompartment shell protein [Dactylosporangium sp.]